MRGLYFQVWDLELFQDNGLAYCYSRRTAFLKHLLLLRVFLSSNRILAKDLDIAGNKKFHFDFRCTDYLHANKYCHLNDILSHRKALVVRYCVDPYSCCPSSWSQKCMSMFFLFPWILQKDYWSPATNNEQGFKITGRDVDVQFIWGR